LKGTNVGLSETLLLGFIAGVTILLGLPIGRLRRPLPGLRVFLNATAVGVLLFLVWDVLSAAWEPLDAALADVHAGTGGLAPVFGYGVLFAAGLAIGLLGLVAYEGWMRRRATRAFQRFGPGAASASELMAPRTGIAGWSPARQLALLIAVGIGLHNFAEGLAIGQSAASGEIALATLLVIGFGLHNATEGFGIVGPLVARDIRPTWRWLAAAGLIGGGPTFLGTVVGSVMSSPLLFVGCLALAAGAIINVVGELIVAGRRMSWELTLWGLFVGFLAGLATDLILVAAGA
jgi:ZIP family zinc transporter